ncbi:MAG: hypothetical protein R2725_10050 [Solirubrobacterales bacterium]
MGSLKRSLFGYRRSDVEAAIASRDTRIQGLQASYAEQLAAIDQLERESASLAGMVLEREREIRVLGERLREANECHQRSIASLDAVSARLEELHEQARGQATRIRMKALREAVEVSRRVQALSDAYPSAEEGAETAASIERAAAAVEPALETASEPPPIAEELEEILPPAPAAPGADGLFQGRLKLEIGPLGDFSQLVGFEDAIGRAGASEISVERFSEGRATLSMRLDEPTELLRELEELSALEFRVRHNAPDNLILDLDDDQGPERHAA